VLDLGYDSFRLGLG